MKRDPRAVHLARCIERLGKPACDVLYDSMRRQVYGLPGDAIPLTDIVHEYADLTDKVDPDGSEKDA